MTHSELISQNILDMLYNRVCVRVGHDLESSPTRLGYDIWKIPLQELQKIEQNPLCIDGIVLEERKLYKKYIDYSTSNVKVFHVLLTRLYMLVKYLHYDDPFYQDSVYKALLPNMGPFRAELSLHIIDDGIAKIRELEKMMQAAKAEKQKNTADMEWALAPYVKREQEDLERLTQLKAQLTEVKQLLKDLEERAKEFKEQNEKLKEQNTLLQKELSEEKLQREKLQQKLANADILKPGEVLLEEIKFHNKVRLDLLLKLMLKAGANLTDHGNKRRAAEVMAVLSGLPLNTCKNFCSDPVVNQDTHEEALDALKKKLQILDINLNIETNSPKQHSGDGTTPRGIERNRQGTPEG